MSNVHSGDTYASQAEPLGNQSAGASQPRPYREFNQQEIVDVFSYHAPTPEQVEIYERINQAFRRCALEIAPVLPDGPGKTVAIRKLADARMAANAAVALGGKF